MSKNLAKLLDQPERLISKTIQALESINNHPSEDTRLLAQNIQASKTKIKQLGLDPQDTTGEELYQALMVKFGHDSLLIDKALGIKTDSTFDQKADKAIQLVEHIVKANESWFLKQSVAKNLLRQQPPKRLMKSLGYRSVESVLKREDTGALYLALATNEPASWQKTFATKISKLAGSDYELRAPQIFKVSNSSTAGQSTSVAYSDIVGAIGLQLSPKIQSASVLTLSLMLVEGLEALVHSEAVQSLGHLNPTLLWWDQSKSLVALCGQDVVSLNLKDAAANQFNKNDFAARESKNGQQSLWTELVAKYQNQVEQAEESLNDLELNIADGMSRLKTRRLPKDLVAEYAEVIADEF